MGKHIIDLQKWIHAQNNGRNVDMLKIREHQRSFTKKQGQMHVTLGSLTTSQSSRTNSWPLTEPDANGSLEFSHLDKAETIPANANGSREFSHLCKAVSINDDEE